MRLANALATPPLGQQPFSKLAGSAFSTNDAVLKPGGFAGTARFSPGETGGFELDAFALSRLCRLFSSRKEGGGGQGRLVFNGIVGRSN